MECNKLTSPSKEQIPPNDHICCLFTQLSANIYFPSFQLRFSGLPMQITAAWACVLKCLTKSNQTQCCHITLKLNYIFLISARQPPLNQNSTLSNIPTKVYLTNNSMQRICILYVHFSPFGKITIIITSGFTIFSFHLAQLNHNSILNLINDTSQTDIL